MADILDGREEYPEVVNGAVFEVDDAEEQVAALGA